MTPLQIQREEERRIQTDIDNEYDFKNGLEYPSDFKEEYPEKGVDIEDYYYDQAPRRMDLRMMGGPCVSSWFLPFGIRRIENWIARQIREGSKYTHEELEKMIKHNLHLHNVIKTNLLSNLKTYANL